MTRSTRVQWFLATPIGLLLLFGWTLALFFHFFSGIRHLVWDAGYGFEQALVRPLRLGGGDRHRGGDAAAVDRRPGGVVRRAMSGTSKTPQVDIMRSPLGRARGLGAARAGAAHWWAQRLTALALVPLTLWFLCAVIRMIGATRDDVVFWMAGPLPIVLMIALVIATFHHLQLGLQVVIEDYVHNDCAARSARSCW